MLAMLAMLGGLAEFERKLIKVRTGEGRARTKARGVKLDRRFKLTPHQRQEAVVGVFVLHVARTVAMRQRPSFSICCERWLSTELPAGMC
jgi:DNA invertase Pin-like site-specific DNA recombinase